MARRVRNDSKATKARLVESATKAFASLGYDHASLRGICANAGVTTGALYFFFDTKEELFAAVLEPLTSTLSYEVTHNQLGEVAIDADGIEAAADADERAARRIVEIASWYPEQLTILLANREHPVVRRFVDELSSEITHQVGGLFQAADVPQERSEAVASWFARVQVSGVFDILARNYPLDEAKSEVATLACFVRGGIVAVMRRAGARRSG